MKQKIVSENIGVTLTGGGTFDPVIPADKLIYMGISFVNTTGVDLFMKFSPTGTVSTIDAGDYWYNQAKEAKYPLGGQVYLNGTGTLVIELQTLVLEQ